MTSQTYVKSFFGLKKNMQAKDWVYFAPSTFECQNLNLHNTNNFSPHF